MLRPQRIDQHQEAPRMTAAPAASPTSNPASAPAASLPRQTLLFMYERMTLIRAFEDRLKALMEAGAPIGVAHFYVGEEAVAVGVCAALQPDDWIASTHRGHGHCIAKGV